ncbi:RpiR-family transcriptional regulator [Escherichia coli]|nr:RpiR-family transcriptional regulator [Escherichia coli]
MNGLLRIRQRYQGLAQSDKKLADYLLLQPDTARHLSSQQLANEAGVSQSSVVKFAQKLGYKGFPALKLALSEALASQPESPSVPIHNQIRGDDPLRLVGEKLIKENTAAMYATLNVNSEEKLHECVNNVALCAADNSDRYWRFGSGGAKLCLEADEDWLQCCRSARYACATRNSTGVVP